MKKNNRKNTIPRTTEDKQKKICKVHWGYCNQDYRT